MKSEELQEEAPRAKRAGRPPKVAAPTVEEEHEEFLADVAEARAAMPEPVIDEAAGDEKLSAKKPTKTKMRQVKIFIDNEKDQPNYKYVGYNGTGYQIKRGEEVWVPECVKWVLENAKAFRPVKNPDGSTTMQSFYTTPFRILDIRD